jgi:hypothetical protein
MKHDLEHLTDADIAAALESLYVPGDHKERLHKEVARRAKAADWDLVGGAFEDGMEECHARVDIGSISIGPIPARSKHAICWTVTAVNLGFAPRMIA